ncbi:hypothetical protein IQ235_10555 [Oscillatoriales cyanobacterium LEGE 11467]|uniref:Uncharacterized protein n=1 Tax=Zarconia navalis LEGE 11467 TaxID=1828826 RepID=A0A928VX63_9CYAN|nr:hypothetical protein [Zarconia navalis]MBE9041219.1 hypothetical protein [Zarconia navalis LEGE 11467]
MNSPKFRNSNPFKSRQESEENPIELVVSVVIASFVVGIIPIVCASTVQPQGEVAPILGEATLWHEAGFVR